MLRFYDALKERPQLGFCNMYPAPGIVERVAPDWDWIWVDGQHGELDYTDMLSAVRACNLVKRAAIVRVPGQEYGHIGKALDMNPEGIMVPMVDKVEHDKGVVYAAKFPPFGSRSYGGRRPIDLDGRSYSHPDQPQPVLICQIETQEGLRNASQIAAVDGVDVIFFGPDDMAMREGMPMDKPRPEGHFDEALAIVAKAAAEHGKLAGGVFTTPDTLVKAVSLGYRLIVASGDVGLLANGSKAATKTLRDAIWGANIESGKTNAQGIY